MPKLVIISMLSLLIIGCAIEKKEIPSMETIKNQLDVKVMVINYDPIIKTEGNKRLHEVCRWNDPRELTKGCIDDLKECSGGYVQYQIVG